MDKEDHQVDKTGLKAIGALVVVILLLLIGLISSYIIFLAIQHIGH